MFNYTINWAKVIADNIPALIRKQRRVDFTTAITKPFQDIYNQFLNLMSMYVQRARFTNEKMYIQKALNLRFDPIGNGIFITNNFPNRFFIFREAEVEPAPVIYREWDAAVNYVAGEFSQVDNQVYMALINNLNKPPGANPTEWSLMAGQELYLYNEAEYSYSDRFIVNVPIAVPYTEEEMRAIIDLYSLAGIEYTITTF